MGKKVLQSDRIYLKLIEKSDLEFLMNLRNDQIICRGIVHTPLSYESQLNWYNNSDTSMQFVITLTEGDIQMGAIGLNDVDYKHQRAEWNIRLDSKFFKKGYANEASKLLIDYVFRTHNINKLVGMSFTENKSARANILKQGFKQEGILKQHFYHNGKFRDIDVFGLLKEEYFNNEDE